MKLFCCGASRTYSSPDPDPTNSHLIETPNGLVVISAQQLFSEADKAIARVNLTPWFTCRSMMFCSLDYLL